MHFWFSLTSFFYNWSISLAVVQKMKIRLGYTVILFKKWFGLESKASQQKSVYLNSFVFNALFFYSRKTSEKFLVFWYFQGVEKGCIVSKWFKSSVSPPPLGLFFLLFLCRTENLIIQWMLESVLIEICHKFNFYYSGVGAS